MLKNNNFNIPKILMLLNVFHFTNFIIHLLIYLILISRLFKIAI